MVSRNFKHVNISRNHEFEFTNLMKTEAEVSREADEDNIWMSFVRRSFPKEVLRPL